MTTTSTATTDPIACSARSVLQTVLSRLGPREFAVQLWGGEQWAPEPDGPADFKLIFRTPNVVRSMFSDVSSLSFGEAYIHGHLDVQGNLIDVFDSGERLLTIHHPPSKSFAWHAGFGRYQRPNTPAAEIFPVFSDVSQIPPHASAPR